MKHHSQLTLSLLVLLACVSGIIYLSDAQAIRQDWHRNMPVYSPADQSAGRVVVDLKGDAYWAVNNQDSIIGQHYIWLEKLDTFAQVKFAVFYPGTLGAHFTDLKIDADGNTYLYGVNYGGSSDGSNTAFLNKYDSTGVLMWSTNFDYDPYAEEFPDQICLSPVNGDVIVTASEYSPQQLVLARFTSGGNQVWQSNFGGYEAGDILVDQSDHIHLATTFHLSPDSTDDHFSYLLLNGNGSIINGFTQTGDHYSHALHSGGKGRTVGTDNEGNFYCVAWVATFPDDSSTWTNIMIYKFDVDGNQTWSKRLERIHFGYPKDVAVLLVDYSTGEMALSGGRGLWRYTTDGTFLGGSFSRNRYFVDAIMYNPKKTFALSSGNPAVATDSGKITHFDWSDITQAFYIHGRADIQFLNSTAIGEPDSAHVAIFVTWSYLGKVSLHRLVLRDTLNTSNTSTDEITESENRIEVYPNPASDIINVIVNENSNEPIEFQVLDLSGKIIIVKSFKNEKNIQLPVNNLSAGIYQVLITQGSHFLSWKLVME